MVHQREFNYYICQLMLTMLQRSPEDKQEVDDVIHELELFMIQFAPKRPPRARARPGRLPFELAKAEDDGEAI